MSDTPEESTESIPAAEPTPATTTTTTAGHPYAPYAEPAYTAPVDVPPHTHPTSRLNKIAAWIGIVAGSLLIVAVIFFTGFALGAHSGGGHHRHHGGGYGDDRGSGMEHRGGPPGFPMGPMMRPGPAFVFPGGPGFPAFPGGPGGPAGPGAPGQGPSVQPNR